MNSTSSASAALLGALLLTVSLHAAAAPACPAPAPGWGCKFVPDGHGGSCACYALSAPDKCAAPPGWVCVSAEDRSLGACGCRPPSKRAPAMSAPPAAPPAAPPMAAYESPDNQRAAASAVKPEEWTVGRIDVDAACSRVKTLQPPVGDLPSLARQRELRNCRADGLYYDVKDNPSAGQAEWDGVRACAYTEEDHAVLMMIFANGYGVPRNLRLAAHYACLGEENREFAVSNVSDPAALAQEPFRAFGPCQAYQNNFAVTDCTTEAHERNARLRGRMLDELSRGWQASQRTAFGQLRAVMLDFVAERGGSETDQRGSGRGTRSAYTEEEVERRFMRDIQQAERGDYPAYTQGEFKTLDKRLNETYRSLLRHMATPGPDDFLMGFGPVTRTDVRNTQRAWLKYRDAWVEFAAVRYPRVPAYAWKAMLTERRVRQLEELDVDARAEDGTGEGDAE